MQTQVDVTTLMRVLGDPTRLAIYEHIVEAGEATVGALTRRSPVSQPAISQHLKALRSAGLVSERRSGRNVHYRAEPRGLEPLLDWTTYYGAFWRERFANLRVL
jgi:DNA-binding transcriptional ArsR family regulator